MENTSKNNNNQEDISNMNVNNDNSTASLSPASQGKDSKRKQSSEFVDDPRFKVHREFNYETNKCVPQYENYNCKLNKNAPAWQIARNPRLASETFKVKGASGKEYKLTAGWIAGFTDSEGTLTFFLNKNNQLTFGYQVQPAYILVQIEADYDLLTAIANFFGCGTVSVNRVDHTSVRYQYRLVDKLLLSEMLIPFFKNVPLCTKKGEEFKVWSIWVEYMNQDKHKINYPHNMIKLLEGLKELKYLGASTKQALAFVDTCDNVIERVKNSRVPRGYS